MHLNLVTPAAAVKASQPGHRVALIRERCTVSPPEIWAECECGEHVSAATPELLQAGFAEHRKRVGADLGR
jgi:hypothetical protein